MHLKIIFFMNVSFFFLSVIFLFAERGTSEKSHATHAVEPGISVEVSWILRGFCVGFARNLILFLFEREREGFKRFAACTVYTRRKR